MSRRPADLQTRLRIVCASAWIVAVIVGIIPAILNRGRFIIPPTLNRVRFRKMIKCSGTGTRGGIIGTSSRLVVGAAVVIGFSLLIWMVRIPNNCICGRVLTEHDIAGDTDL